MDRFVTPFRSWHYHWITAQEAAEGLVPVEMGPALLLEMEKQNWWTGIVDGSPIVIAGTMQLWAGRHEANAYLTAETQKHMLWITRETLRGLDEVYGRVECTVRKGFVAGHRWMKLLGFRVETPTLERFGPLGEDHVGYVRIRG